MKVERLYDDRELFEKICLSIAEIGGEIEIVDRFHNLFKLNIAPELQEHANMVIQDTIDTHALQRKRAREEDPFLGVKVMVRDLQE